MIRITCKADNGMRRAGVYHPKGARDYADDAFTPSQLAAIEADPAFTVERIEGEPANTEAKAADPLDAERERIRAEFEEVLLAAADRIAELERKVEELTAKCAGLEDELAQARAALSEKPARKGKGGKA